MVQRNIVDESGDHLATSCYDKEVSLKRVLVSLLSHSPEPNLGTDAHFYKQLIARTKDL
jgi:hypothetical protein